MVLFQGSGKAVTTRVRRNTMSQSRAAYMRVVSEQSDRREQGGRRIASVSEAVRGLAHPEGRCA